METREKENLAERYQPNGKCEEFIRLVGSDKCFVNLFSAANGVGKCLPLDSPILMADGAWKKLEEIKKGDYVLGHDYDGDKIAVPSQVIGISRAGKKEVFKFYFRDGGFVVASKEHSFPIKLRSGRKSSIQKRQIEEVLKRKVSYIGGKLKFQQPKAISFKSNSKLPIHPYLLGALIGDGGLTEGLRFTNQNQTVVARIKKLVELEKCQLKQYGRIEYRIVQYSHNKQGYSINILLEKIRKLKLNVKSENKFIPHTYKIASVEDRKQLLAGLIDTDGTFNEYLTKSKKLAEDFVFLVRTLGGIAILKERVVNNKFTKGEDSLFYRLYWRFDYELPLSKTKKQRVSKKPIEYTNRFVVKIESMGFVECGDITIDHPKHCYISYDFISTGNTAVAVNIITNLCFGVQNDFFKLPLFENYKYLKKGRIISDPTTIKEKIVPELKKWFPSNRYQIHYETKKDGKQYERSWTCDTGFSFDLLTTEQDVKEFESVECGWILIDEPCPRSIYLASIARARMGMIMFWTMTPLSYSAWVDDEIISKRDGVNWDYITADIEQNCREHGVRGILEHAHIERMIAQYPAEEREARIHGRFGRSLGRVHKLFNNKIHVVTPFRITREQHCVYMALDTHPRVNDAVLWLAVDRDGQKYIIDELWIKTQLPELARTILARETQYRIMARLIDPSAYNTDDRVNTPSISQQLYLHGLMFAPGSKDLVGGIRRVDEALLFTEEGGNILREPELHVFSTCERLIWELEKGYVWDEFRGRSAEEKDPKASPKDKDDHMVENLHRLLMIEPRFKDIETTARKHKTGHAQYSTF